VKFAFIAKHRGIWPASLLCGALGVSRGGFYAWLTRPRSARKRHAGRRLVAQTRLRRRATH
jgi:putative transposase